MPNEDRAQIIYKWRKAGQWQSDQVLNQLGWIGTRSTRVVIDPNDDTIHVCYMRKLAIDSPDPYLAYQKIVNGIPGPEYQISLGGWHSRMQLDDNNRAMFIREGVSSLDQSSQLKLFRTTDGVTWSETPVDIPNDYQFTIGNFIYKNGIYHITYGDGAYTKKVLNGKASTEYVDGTFHNFFYASSTDGEHWSPSLVDSSGTLYEKEFWTTLTLDNDVPVVAFFKYAEYNQLFAIGTSALMARRYGGNKWKKRIIAGDNFPDSGAGMGVTLITNGPNDLFGAWNDSPRRPINFFKENIEEDITGSIALYRSGPNDSWTYKGLLEPFSAEGIPRIRIHNNRLFFLVLGDWENTKLYFREYDISALPALADVPVPQFPANRSFAGSTFMMNWSTVPQADFYYMLLYRNGIKYSDVWRLGSDSEHFVSYLPDGSYEWWVQRYANGEGSWSLSSRFQVGGSTLPPLTPGSVSASDGRYRDVALSWDAAPGAQSYEIYRHTVPLPITAPRIAYGITNTWYTDTTAQNGLVYYYWVKSVTNGVVSRFGTPNSGYKDNTMSSVPIGPPVAFNPGIYLLLR
ncbi:MAG: hypothetical protein KKI15_05390 [Proteobacteria bacterium]|nr:hypothetical protein [Pseudomonadota bacterium]